MTTRARIYVMQTSDGALKLGYSVDPMRRRAQLEAEKNRAVTILHETDVLDEAGRIEGLAHRASLEDAILAIETAIRQAEGEELELGGQANTRGGRRSRQITMGLRLTPELMDRIEDLMRERIDGADKGQVIRELVARGLAAIDAERKGKKS